MAKPNFLDEKHYFGTVNPTIQDDDPDVLGLTKSQEQFIPEGLKGVPIHINHMTEAEGGKIPASGEVTNVFIGKKKDVQVVFRLYDNDAGRYAHSFLHGDKPMRELSLGTTTRCLKNDIGENIPFATKLDEVSICFKGDQQSTTLKACYDAAKGELVAFNHEGDDDNIYNLNKIAKIISHKKEEITTEKPDISELVQQKTIEPNMNKTEATNNSSTTETVTEETKQNDNESTEKEDVEMGDKDENQTDDLKNTLQNREKEIKELQKQIRLNKRKEREQERMKMKQDAEKQKEELEKLKKEVQEYRKKKEEEKKKQEEEERIARQIQLNKQKEEIREKLKWLPKSVPRDVFTQKAMNDPDVLNMVKAFAAATEKESLSYKNSEHARKNELARKMAEQKKRHEQELLKIKEEYKEFDNLAVPNSPKKRKLQQTTTSTTTSTSTSTSTSNNTANTDVVQALRQQHQNTLAQYIAAGRPIQEISTVASYQENVEENISRANHQYANNPAYQHGHNLISESVGRALTSCQNPTTSNRMFQDFRKHLTDAYVQHYAQQL